MEGHGLSIATYQNLAWMVNEAASTAHPYVHTILSLCTDLLEMIESLTAAILAVNQFAETLPLCLNRPPPATYLQNTHRQHGELLRPIPGAYSIPYPPLPINT